MAWLSRFGKALQAGDLLYVTDQLEALKAMAREDEAATEEEDLLKIVQDYHTND